MPSINFQRFPKSWACSYTCTHRRYPGVEFNSGYRLEAKLSWPRGDVKIPVWAVKVVVQNRNDSTSYDKLLQSFEVQSIPQVKVTLFHSCFPWTNLIWDRIGSRCDSWPVSLFQPPLGRQLVAEAFKACGCVVHLFAMPFCENIKVEKSLGTRLEPLCIL